MASSCGSDTGKGDVKTIRRTPSMCPIAAIADHNEDVSTPRPEVVDLQVDSLH